MNLKKVILLALSACAVVALVAPAAASAVELSDSEGTLHVGAEVTATSHDLVTDPAVFFLPNLECETVTLHGEVTEEGPGSVHIVETTEPTLVNCNEEINHAEGGEITIEEGGTGTVTGAFFEVEETCEFAGNIPVSYETNTDVMTVTGEDQFSGNCGTATMTGNFTLETTNGDPVTIT